MKMELFWPAAALLLLLAGCQTGNLPESSPSLPQEAEAALASEALSPTVEPFPSSGPLEELLAQQSIDDDHDAFLVPTGGRLGTLLVTAVRGEQDLESEFGGYHTTLSVWNPQDMDSPIQIIDTLVEDWAFGVSDVVDANFDGYTDFGYMWFLGNQPSYWHYWLWNEGLGQFVEEPAFRDISSPSFDPETETVEGWARNSAAGDGVTTFHCWEDGELVCVRRIEAWYDLEDTEELVFEMTVQDRIDGELTQVYYEERIPEEEFFYERYKRKHLDYHGET